MKNITTIKKLGEAVKNLENISFRKIYSKQDHNFAISYSSSSLLPTICAS